MRWITACELALRRNLPVAEQGLGRRIALLECQRERLGRGHPGLVGEAARLGPPAVLTLRHPLIAQVDCLSDLLGREQPGALLGGLLDHVQRIGKRPICLRDLPGGEPELQARMDVSDRFQAVDAQDLRPQVRIAEMLRREIPQRVAFLDPDRQDLFGLRKRALPDQPAAAQHQP